MQPTLKLQTHTWDSLHASSSFEAHFQDITKHKPLYFKKTLELLRRRVKGTHINNVYQGGEQGNVLQHQQTAPTSSEQKHQLQNPPFYTLDSNVATKVL